MSIEDYDPKKDILINGRTLVGGGINSNSNSYEVKNVYCDPNGKITYSGDNSCNSKIVGVVFNDICDTNYVYAPYVPLQVTQSINTKINAEDCLFKYLSNSGKISSLLRKVDKIRGAL